MASESLDTGYDLALRLAAARREVEANILRLDMARTRLLATRQRISAGRAEREVRHDSVFARLTARLDNQPVIEQAKGILIAQIGCTADEATTGGEVRAWCAISSPPSVDVGIS